MTVHNRYPQEWAKIIREAVSEAGRDDDILFFMRSAWTISSRYVSLYW
jgi:alpha-glucosidase